MPTTPSPGRLSKRSTRSWSALAALIVLAIGCSERDSTEAASRTSVETSDAATPGATTSINSIRPSVTVPVLSRIDDVDRAGVLEHLATLDDHAELGTTTGADHDRQRGGQARGRTGRR